jgi:hypothetical protein
MFRRLLAVTATLVLPAILVAQARPATSTAKAGTVHPSATQRFGDVVRPTADARPAGDVDHNQATGDKDEQQGPDAKEGPEAKEGPDADEGPDAKEAPRAKAGSDADEGPEAQEGPDAKEGPEVGDGPHVERSEKGDDKQGENENGKPVAPAAAGHASRVGSHKP